MVIKIVLVIWMAAVVAASFLYLPPAKGFADPEAARLIVYHVPCAVIATIAFLIAALFAVSYLGKRDSSYDAKSAVSCELGLIFAALATITGSIFARFEWNSWWNWDPRETSIVILLLIYAAYFALRSAVEDNEKRARLSAVYAILALPAMGFLMFIMPRVMPSLHPSSAHLGTEYRIVLYSAMLGFLGIYVWLFRAKLKRDLNK